MTNSLYNLIYEIMTIQKLPLYCCTVGGVGSVAGALVVGPEVVVVVVGLDVVVVGLDVVVVGLDAVVVDLDGIVTGLDGTIIGIGGCVGLGGLGRPLTES